MAGPAQSIPSSHAESLRTLNRSDSLTTERLNNSAGGGLGGGGHTYEAGSTFDWEGVNIAS